MRSLFKGVLGFGLVSIPVSLYRAVGDERVETHWIHRDCGERVRYQKHCPACDRVLEPADLVRVAVLPDGRMVPLDEEGRDPGPQDRTISVLTFHPLADLDPVYFDRAYWLKAQTGGQKAYQLLARAMVSRHQVAVARMTARERPRLAVVRPYGTGALMLHSMHWPESVRREGAHFGTEGAAPTSDREEEMALALVDQLSEPFQPAQYPDEARARLMADLVARAQAGGAVTPPPPAGLESLVEQLSRSLKAVGAVSEAAAAR